MGAILTGTMGTALGTRPSRGGWLVYVYPEACQELVNAVNNGNVYHGDALAMNDCALDFLDHN